MKFMCFISFAVTTMKKICAVCVPCNAEVTCLAQRAAGRARDTGRRVEF